MYHQATATLLYAVQTRLIRVYSHCSTNASAKLIITRIFHLGRTRSPFGPHTASLHELINRIMLSLRYFGAFCCHGTSLIAQSKNLFMAEAQGLSCLLTLLTLSLVRLELGPVLLNVPVSEWRAFL